MERATTEIISETEVLIPMSFFGVVDRETDDATGEDPNVEIVIRAHVLIPACQRCKGRGRRSTPSIVFTTISLKLREPQFRTVN